MCRTQNAIPSLVAWLLGLSAPTTPTKHAINFEEFFKPFDNCVRWPISVKDNIIWTWIIDRHLIYNACMRRTTILPEATWTAKERKRERGAQRTHTECLSSNSRLGELCIIIRVSGSLWCRILSCCLIKWHFGAHIPRGVECARVRPNSITAAKLFLLL